MLHFFVSLWRWLLFVWLGLRDWFHQISERRTGTVNVAGITLLLLLRRRRRRLLRRRR
eukprot:COSAG06_NODE_934_length_11440_cov_5.939335_1_plen_57_part_10